MEHGGHRSGELGIWGQGSQEIDDQGRWGKGKERQWCNREHTDTQMGGVVTVKSTGLRFRQTWV